MQTAKVPTFVTEIDLLLKEFVRSSVSCLCVAQTCQSMETTLRGKSKQSLLGVNQSLILMSMPQKQWSSNYFVNILRLAHAWTSSEKCSPLALRG